MADNNIMGLVGAFIGIAIMLGIGVQILGNSVADCTALPDYDEADGTDQAAGTWAAQCYDNNTQTQNAYTLLIIILIVVAAVAILSVVRMLG